MGAESTKILFLAMLINLKFIKNSLEPEFCKKRRKLKIKCIGRNEPILTKGYFFFSLSPRQYHVFIMDNICSSRLKWRVLGACLFSCSRFIRAMTPIESPPRILVCIIYLNLQCQIYTFLFLQFCLFIQWFKKVFFFFKGVPRVVQRIVTKWDFCLAWLSWNHAIFFGAALYKVRRKKRAYFRN